MKSSCGITFRIISSVVLFFFTWTFGGVFDLAFAAKEVGSIGQKERRPEERFQKAIEEIEQALADTVTDTDTKKKRLKTKRAEVDSLDTEIRKQFTETEDRIKDLPAEIKQRHRDFVKKYEDNLKELKTNLDNIEKAKTKAESDVEVEKARKYLEKVKPPKKYIPLDPNKLPHRTPEVEKREPRTTPEQFLSELRAEVQKSRSAEATPLNPPLARGELKRGHEPILLASNGSLDGLLTPNSELITLNAITPTPNPQSPIPNPCLTGAGNEPPHQCRPRRNNRSPIHARNNGKGAGVAEQSGKDI